MKRVKMTNYKLDELLQRDLVNYDLPDLQLEFRENGFAYRNVSGHRL